MAANGFDNLASFGAVSKPNISVGCWRTLWQVASLGRWGCSRWSIECCTGHHGFPKIVGHGPWDGSVLTGIRPTGSLLRWNWNDTLRFLGAEVWDPAWMCFSQFSLISPKVGLPAKVCAPSSSVCISGLGVERTTEAVSHNKCCRKDPALSRRPSVMLMRVIEQPEEFSTFLMNVLISPLFSSAGVMVTMPLLSIWTPAAMDNGSAWEAGQPFRSKSHRVSKDSCAQSAI